MSVPVSRQRPWKALMKKIDYTFKKPEHLYRAFTHLSLVGAERQFHLSNQRLEFLGDAALRLALAETLHSRWPKASEGEMTREISRLSSNRQLAKMAASLDLPAFLLTGAAAGKDAAATQASVKADTFEALIGAIFVDGGWEAVLAFVMRHFEIPPAPPEEKIYETLNPKGDLQERLTKISPKAKPEYHLLKTEGPPHKQTFYVELRIAGEEISSGQGSSRQKAEMDAARQAVERMIAEEKKAPGDYPVA